MSNLFKDATVEIISPKEPSFLLMVSNDGGKLLETNYFQTEIGKAGAIYLSWNANEARLLIPKAQEQRVLPEIKNAFHVELEVVGPQIFLWFDDGLPQQYCVSISKEMTDRVLNKIGDTKIHVYSESNHFYKTYPLRVLTEEALMKI